MNLKITEPELNINLDAPKKRFVGDFISYKIDIKNIRDWLIYVLCLEAFILAKSNDDFLTFVRDRFEFFGVQSPSPREIADFATNFGLKDLVDYVSTNKKEYNV